MSLASKNLDALVQLVHPLRKWYHSAFFGKVVLLNLYWRFPDLYVSGDFLDEISSFVVKKQEFTEFPLDDMATLCWNGGPLKSPVLKTLL